MKESEKETRPWLVGTGGVWQPGTDFLSSLVSDMVGSPLSPSGLYWLMHCQAVVVRFGLCPFLGQILDRPGDRGRRELERGR